MPCNRCGKCCSPIRMPAHQTIAFFQDVANDMTKLPPDRRDAGFIVENWDLIGQVGGDLFYSCKLLKGGLCTAYEKRPSLCSCFPFYHQTKIPDRVKLPDGCGYATGGQR